MAGVQQAREVRVRCQPGEVSRASLPRALEAISKNWLNVQTI